MANEEREARYKAREQYRAEGCFNNPYKLGSFQSLCFLDEAQKIRFEYERSE